jgi:hypothetical protein
MMLELLLQIPLEVIFLMSSKLAAIKVYEVELLLSWKLVWLSNHNQWLCHFFSVYDP